MQPTLHLLCGKVAAGKSSLARRLAEAPATVLLVEDEWTSRLYPGELITIEDYAVRAARIREGVGPPAAQLLRAGLSVVLDFQGNTLKVRAWMRGIFEAAGTAHQLHVLNPPDEVCKARLRARNASGQHPYQVSDAEYDAISAYFVPPAPEEGFNVVSD